MHGPVIHIKAVRGNPDCGISYPTIFDIIKIDAKKGPVFIARIVEEK